MLDVHIYAVVRNIFQPLEVNSDVISGKTVHEVGLDVRRKCGESTFNHSSVIRPAHFVRTTSDVLQKRLQ